MDLDGATGFDRGFLTEQVDPPVCDPAELLAGLCDRRSIRSGGRRRGCSGRPPVTTLEAQRPQPAGFGGHHRDAVLPPEEPHRAVTGSEARDAMGTERWISDFGGTQRRPRRPHDHHPSPRRQRPAAAPRRQVHHPVAATAHRGPQTDSGVPLQNHRLPTRNGIGAAAVGGANRAAQRRSSTGNVSATTRVRGSNVIVPGRNIRRIEQAGEAVADDLEARMR